MLRKQKKSLTEGSILSSLLRLSIPIIAANTLQTAYQLIDTFWLGRLGAYAVAAVSLSFPLLFLIFSIGGGLTLAGSVLVAQYRGMNDQKLVNYSSAQTIFVMFFVSIALMLAGIYGAEPLMRFIGADENIFTESVNYFRVSSYGFVFLFIFFVFQSLMRGIGNVLLPTFVVLSTVLLNLVLDPLFIYGWGPIPAMGVSGAAMASVGTQGLSAFIGLFILLNGKQGIKVHLQDLKPDWPWTKKLFKLGFPASIEQSTRALGMTMMIILVVGYGSEVVASYGIGARILGFVVIPALGLSISTTTLVGQNIGAGKVYRAERVAVLSGKVAFWGLSGIGMLLFFAARPLTAFFVPDDEYVIYHGAMFIKIMAPSFGLLGLQQVMNGVFNGAGFTLASMLISLIGLWIVRFPLAYVLSNNTVLGFEGIWWAFPISNLIAAIVALIWFKNGQWKQRLKRK